MTFLQGLRDATEGDFSLATSQPTGLLLPQEISSLQWHGIAYLWASHEHKVLDGLAVSLNANLCRWSSIVGLPLLFHQGRPSAVVMTQTHTTYSMATRSAEQGLLDALTHARDVSTAIRSFVAWIAAGLDTRGASGRLGQMAKRLRGRSTVTTQRTRT